MSHLTDLPKESSEQTVYRICSIVHNFLDENYEMIEPAPSKYKKTVFGKAETTVFDTIVESSPMSHAMSGLSETSRPIPRSLNSHSQISDFREHSTSNFTTVRPPASTRWKSLLLKTLLFLAIGMLAGVILLQF